MVVGMGPLLLVYGAHVGIEAAALSERHGAQFTLEGQLFLVDRGHVHGQTAALAERLLALATLVRPRLEQRTNTSNAITKPHTHTHTPTHTQ